MGKEVPGYEMPRLLRSCREEIALGLLIWQILLEGNKNGLGDRSACLFEENHDPAIKISKPFPKPWALRYLLRNPTAETKHHSTAWETNAQITQQTTDLCQAIIYSTPDTI